MLLKGSSVPVDSIINLKKCQTFVGDNRRKHHRSILGRQSVTSRILLAPFSIPNCLNDQRQLPVSSTHPAPPPPLRPCLDPAQAPSRSELFQCLVVEAFSFLLLASSCPESPGRALSPSHHRRWSSRLHQDVGLLGANLDAKWSLHSLHEGNV